MQEGALAIGAVGGLGPSSSSSKHTISSTAGSFGGGGAGGVDTGKDKRVFFTSSVASWISISVDPVDFRFRFRFTLGNSVSFVNAAICDGTIVVAVGMYDSLRCGISSRFFSATAAGVTKVGVGT